MMKTIKVQRRTGCSYEGVVFDDGVTVIHWKGYCPSTTVFRDYYEFYEQYIQKSEGHNISVEIKDFKV